MLNHFCADNRVIYINWENTLEPDRSQVTQKYVACALHSG